MAVAGVSALVIRYARPWLVSTKGLTGTARLDELNRVRVALVLVVVAALAAAVAIYAFKTFSRDLRVEHTEREPSERFMRAIDQIGHPALDVRLGGTYSLERLAQESAEDHGPIIEILAAFVREHAPWPARAARCPERRRPRPRIRRRRARRSSRAPRDRRPGRGDDSRPAQIANDSEATIGLPHTPCPARC